MFINQMDMRLNILPNKTIADVQREFNSAYPFLKIEFYKNIEQGFSRRQLNHSSTIQSAGVKHEGHLEIMDSMTVGQLENTFKNRFGLNAQVSRKSGILWLETTISDAWTLKQQNDHGRELSQHEKPENIEIDEFEKD